jgi:hypothetical protein
MLSPRRLALVFSLFGFVAAGGIVAAVLVISTGPTPVRARNHHDDPAHVALAWFKAIDTHNVRAAYKLYEPSERSQIAWISKPAIDLPTFSNIHCLQTSLKATTASVRCTFVESRSPSEGNPDTSWAISFRRSPNDGWLIANYGQD